MKTTRAAASPRGRSVTPALPNVLQFMQVLWRLVHGLERTSKRMTVTHGVTGPQRLVLRLVGLRPGISAGDLAAMLHVHPSTLTGVLRRLHTQGLLVRAAHPGDRRRAVLHLTRKGHRVNARRHGTAEAAVERALRRVPTRMRLSVERTLAAVADTIEA